MQNSWFEGSKARAVTFASSAQVKGGELWDSVKSLSKKQWIVILAIVGALIAVAMMYPIIASLVTIVLAAVILPYAIESLAEYRFQTTATVVLMGFLLMMFYFEPAWTVPVAVLTVAVMLYGSIDRLQKYKKTKTVLIVLLAAAVLWQPLAIHVFYYEYDVTVGKPEDTGSKFNVTVKPDDGKKFTVKLREVEVFALRFERTLLWDEFTQDRRLKIRVYGIRWLRAFGVYPKVISATPV
ncbi:MAG: hypothetical protein ACKUBY_05940 [Candidatus Moraniibacteriota bacterium]|jgi:hypothetical protein